MTNPGERCPGPERRAGPVGQAAIAVQPVRTALATIQASLLSAVRAGRDGWR